MQVRDSFRFLPGILLASLLAGGAYYLSTQAFFRELGMSSLVLAMVLGLCAGSTVRVYLPPVFSYGLTFSAKRILRLAVMLYGFRITFQDVVQVGPAALFLDVMIVGLTLFIAFFLGIRVFRLTRAQSLLIGGGAAICGAAAVLAFEGILKNEHDETAMAVMTVVLFGTLAMFLYPVLQHSGWLGLLPKQYAIYTGGTVHEVAQVVVAGSAISKEAGEWAVVVKMVRVMLLVPVLFLLGRFCKSESSKMVIPWFAVGFVLVIALNSFHLLSKQWVDGIIFVDVLLLTIAMAALGIETNLVKVVRLGLKPFYLALSLFAWLILGGYALAQLSFVLFSVH